MADPEYNKWGSDPVSQKLDEWVSKMPDRPATLLAVINYNADLDGSNRKALQPFNAQLFREIPFDCLGAKLTVYFLGFDATDADAFLRLIAALPALGIDEAAVYLNGAAKLRITKLVPTVGPSRTFTFKG